MRSRGQRENPRDNRRDAERFFARATREANWCGPDAEAIVICIATAFASGGRRIRLPLREIALKAGVSVTTASETLKVLDNLGLLSVRQRGRSATRLHRPRYPETAPRRPIPPLPPRIWASGAQGHKRRVVFDAVRGATLSFGHLVEAVNAKVRRSASSIRNDLRELERIGLLEPTQRRGIRTWGLTLLLPEEVVEPRLLRRVAAREARIAAERANWYTHREDILFAAQFDREVEKCRERARASGVRLFDGELLFLDEPGGVFSPEKMGKLANQLRTVPLNQVINGAIACLYLDFFDPRDPFRRSMVRFLHELGVTRDHRRGWSKTHHRIAAEDLFESWENQSLPDRVTADENMIHRYVRLIAGRDGALDEATEDELYDDLEALGVTVSEADSRAVAEERSRDGEAAPLESVPSSSEAADIRSCRTMSASGTAVSAQPPTRERRRVIERVEFDRYESRGCPARRSSRSAPSQYAAA